jgi:hypothetical protein
VSDTNPYSPSSVPIERQPFRRRLVSFLDIAAFICAGLPIASFAATGVLANIYPGDPSNAMQTLLAVLYAASACLWLLAGGYNLIGAVLKRRVPMFGVAVNVASLLLWGILIWQFSMS